MIPPISATPAVRAAIRDIDPAVAVFGVEPLADTPGESIAAERFVTMLLSLFAGLALLLPAIGIHEVLAYAVARRSREIGIRIALGATCRRVSRLLVREAAAVFAAGLAAGLLLGTVSAGCRRRCSSECARSMRRRWRAS